MAHQNPSINATAALNIIRRQKLCGIGYHYGLTLPDGRVMHMDASRGIEIVSLNSFASGHLVEPVAHQGAVWDAQAALRLNEAISANRRYDLFAWNCETLANWVARGKAESREVQAWFLIASLVALLAAFDR